MAFPNPVLIQKGPNSVSAPLVFIHDGGGTAFNYFFLGDLGRDFYGISNPRFESGSQWDGGIPEMAAEYLKLIGNHLPDRNIILGGWSLGGLVALEVYHQLASNPAFNIIGLIMLDSPFPHTRDTQDYEVNEADMEFDPMTRVEIREKITHCLRGARQMIRTWNVPVLQTQNTTGYVGTHHQAENASRNESEVSNKTTQRVVPVLLIKAIDQVPSRRGRPLLPFLGWDQCDQGIVKEMYEIPGHHFSIFKSQNIDACTSALREACNRLATGDVDSDARQQILMHDQFGGTSSERV